MHRVAGERTAQKRSRRTSKAQGEGRQPRTCTAAVQASVSSSRLSGRRKQGPMDRPGRSRQLGALKPGGFEALSDNLREQVMADADQLARQVRQGRQRLRDVLQARRRWIGGHRKYVDRIWGDVDDVALLLHMDADEQGRVHGGPRAPGTENASAMLSQLGMWEEQVTQGVQRAMRRGAESADPGCRPPW